MIDNNANKGQRIYNEVFFDFRDISTLWMITQEICRLQDFLQSLIHCPELLRAYQCPLQDKLIFCFW